MLPDAAMPAAANKTESSTLCTHDGWEKWFPATPNRAGGENGGMEAACGKL
ncbi:MULTISPECIES: hypothetical protein [unclassified Neisseria]|uniref:hypothetical protein n=1 Tax=unclassified Neisseria TaxID=2623750 RepID=UPI00143223C3|nr:MULTISPECIES: hypothetical protein [unclassified Neisseria]MBF0803619.1 hypothetical protein [Neisseria sp. 19428wB4_WF04]